ncbi:hypothetical protein MASR2M66_29540 [Chloroflexota bacterium]
MVTGIFVYIILGLIGIVGLISLPFIAAQTDQGGLVIAETVFLIPVVLLISSGIGSVMSKEMGKSDKSMTKVGFWMGSLGLPALLGVFTIAGMVIAIGTNISNNIPRQNITFVGKITDVNRDWLNNRLVVAYLKNEEVGRNISTAGKSGFTDIVTDGYFSVTTPNIYEITAYQIPNEEMLLNIKHDFLSLYIQLGEKNEGYTESFFVPSRKLTYVVKILDGDINSLPPEILQPGSTRLRDDGQIIVDLPGSISADGTQTSGIFVQDISYAKKTERVETNKLTVPINNCAGSVEVSQKYSQSQTFVHQYTGEVGFNIGIEIPFAAWAKLTPEFTAKYGFENGQVDTRTVEYNMAAAPGTNVVYIVTWSEVWETGTANVINGNDTIVVPFRVKTNLIYDIASEPRTCP